MPIPQFWKPPVAAAGEKSSGHLKPTLLQWGLLAEAVAADCSPKALALWVPLLRVPFLLYVVLAPMLEVASFGLNQEAITRL